MDLRQRGQLHSSIRRLKNNLYDLNFMDDLSLWLIVEIFDMKFIKYYLCFVYHIPIGVPINYVGFSCLLRGERLIKKLWKVWIDLLSFQKMEIQIF